MCSTQNGSDERLGSRVPVSAHRTRHRLKRSRPALSPRFKTGGVKVMTACRFCCSFPREVAIAHRTLRRNFRCRWKQIGTLCMSPAHFETPVLGALALRPTLDHFRTPLVHPRNSPRTWWNLILCVNTARRTPNRTLVFTRCTGTCHRGALHSYRRGRTGWTRRTRVCSVWHETVDTKKSCDCRRKIQVLSVHIRHYFNQTFDECSHCLIMCMTFLYLPWVMT
jgi:hypothetical protein